MKPRMNPWNMCDGRACLIRWGWAPLCAVLWMLSFSGTYAGEPQLRVSLQPAEIALGEAATLNVMVEGTASAGSPVIPPVDGLEFRSVGQSTQLQFINGAMTGGITYLIQIIPSRSGDFNIPEVTVQADRVLLKAPALTLKVTGGVSGPKNGTPAQIPPAAAPGPSNRAQTPSTDPMGQVGGIEFIFPKRDFYVGELIPVDLKVYLRQGLEISRVSLPMLSGNAFTMSKLGENPDRSNEMVDGRGWHVLTWHTAVAAVKAGDHTLGAKMGCTLLVVAKGRRAGPAPFDDFFNDPFFDSFFQRKEEKDVTLASREVQIRVVDLPANGKPADFSGAIGQFQLNPVWLSSHEVTAGDPITLKTTILGTGNFDRVEAPQLSDKVKFKIYPPSGKFEPTDEAGYSGQKVFEQVVIPQSSDIHEVPSISFSYFNPESQKYVTLTTDSVPLHVEVAKPDRPTPSVPTMASNPSLPASHRVVRTSRTDIVGNKLEIGSPGSFRLVMCQPVFWAGVGLPPLFVLGLALKVRRDRRLQESPHLARNQEVNRLVRRQLKLMAQAQAGKDGHAFFSAARRALQEKLSDRLNCPPEAVTFAEVEACEDLDVSFKQQIRPLFEATDALLYSGQQIPGEGLAAWKARVEEVIKKL